MSGHRDTCLWGAVAALLLAMPAAAQNQHDMTFHTVPPCTVVDTRLAGGAFSVGETRAYNVAGAINLTSQGGSSTSGCGIPGWSSNIAQAQAVELAISGINPAGSGYIAANAADQTMAGAVVNLASSVAVVTNTGPVAVATTPGSGDFKVYVGFTTTHVLVRVVGYYTKPVQTVWVHPVPGDATASGAALISAVGNITNASATKPYVVKIEPGIYDLGTNMLSMKSYVDLEGSGQQATIIQGAGAAVPTTGVVSVASSSELRDLQVKSTGGVSDLVAIPILVLDSVDTHIRRVTATASGPNPCSLFGIRLRNSASEVTDTTVNVSGGGSAQGIVSKGTSVSGISTIRNTRITVTNAASTAYGFLVDSGSSLTQIEEVHVEVSGGSMAYGFYQDNGASIPSRISRSTIRAANIGADVASGGLLIDSSEIAGVTNTATGLMNIGGSKLDGGPALGPITCAGVWDESYVFYSGPACP